MPTDDDVPMPPQRPRHRLFADRVLAGDCLVTAYLAAGYRGTPASASSQASKLRKRPEVAAYIDAVQRRAADESTLTLLEIRRFLARIVRTPLTELDADGGRDADLIKTVARTSSTTRLEKLDPLKAIEIDLKISGQDPETSLLKQMARALETLPTHGPLPENQL
jgi:hypothetical protein